jgi:porphobilinogen deaminase
LGGDCHSPIGAWARWEGGKIVLDGMMGAAGGELPVKRAGIATLPAGLPAAIAQLAAALR